MSPPARAQSRPNTFDDHLLARGGNLSPAAHRVVTFIDQNRATVLASSAVDIAAATRTSDATVVRAIQALGFDGLIDLKGRLVEALGRHTTPLEHMRRTLAEVGESADRATALVLDAHDEALGVLRTESFQEVFRAATAKLNASERIVVFGVGPTGALAGYVSTLLVRAGRRSAVLDKTGQGLADQLLGLAPGDVLLIMAYGPSYREVTTLFEEAQRLRLETVLVTDNTSGKLARSASVVLPIPRGRAERVALHGATLVAMEALVLGLNALGGPRAIAALGRLGDLRRRL